MERPACGMPGAAAGTMQRWTCGSLGGALVAGLVHCGGTAASPAGIDGASDAAAPTGAVTDAGVPSDAGAEDAASDAGGISLATRVAAAEETAQNHALCQAVRPFYWEIGEREGALASGSVTSPTDDTVYVATTRLAIASASKWTYGAYWAEKTGGALSDTDIRFLHFQSGYTSFSSCNADDTVGSCLLHGNNGVLNPANVGKFAYGGGHMQNHAAKNGLAELDAVALGAELCARIGCDTASFGYGQPQPAGGVSTTSAEYAKFLRRILAGQLKIRDLLGTSAVCTNPTTCATAVSSPAPEDEDWSYSIGHWVETDPKVGDGAFSSAGAFGFYPWIDATKTYYGLVGRQHFGVGEKDGFQSAKCGRLIRKAFVTGVAP